MKRGAVLALEPKRLRGKKVPTDLFVLQASRLALVEKIPA
jgi:hypothetical protein